MTSPITIPTLYKMKERGEKIVSLTAYDYPLARLVDTSGVHMSWLETPLAWWFRAIPAPCR